MCRAIEIMKEENKQLRAENRQAKAETREVRAELTAELKAERKEHNREKKLLIKMLKESGRSEAEIKSYLNSAVLANA